MRSLFSSSALIGCVCAWMSIGCQPAESVGAASASQAAKSQVTHAIAVLQPTEGNKAKGKVTFEALQGNKVKVTARVEGLKPNSRHGFHIHEFGDISAPNGTAAGDHYNPEGHMHALPEKGARHAGDLGNLEANAEGVAEYEITVENVTLAGAKNPIVGRGLIVHANPDDGGQPTGNAGPRIAQAVIGVAKAPESSASE